MLYGMPMSLFVSGFFFPIGVLLYWFTNNLWTLGQQFFILRKMPPPGSDAHKAKAAADKPAVDPRTLAPKPGAKPVRPKPGRPAAAPRGTDGAVAARCGRPLTARLPAGSTADGGRRRRPGGPTPAAGQSPPNRGQAQAPLTGTGPPARLRRPGRRTDHRGSPGRPPRPGRNLRECTAAPVRHRWRPTVPTFRNALLPDADSRATTPALPDADSVSDDAVVEAVDDEDEPDDGRGRRSRVTTCSSARATSPATTSSGCSTSSTWTATSTSTSRATGPRSRSSAAAWTT